MWHGVQVVLGQVKSEDTTSRSLPVFRRIESEPTTTTEIGTPSSIGDPLLGYLAALQFTSSEVQNFLALQCLYDALAQDFVFSSFVPSKRDESPKSGKE